MKIETELHESIASKHLRAFIRLLLANGISKRIENLYALRNENALLEAFFIENHFIEFAVSNVLKQKRKSGRFPKPSTSHEILELYNLATGFMQIFKNVGVAAKRRLIGQIRDSLKSDHGFLSLHHEIGLAVNCCRRGFNVEFPDLHETGRFDILADYKDLAIEIEVKTVSADIGRKIHQKKIAQLGHVFQKILLPLVPVSGTAIYVKSRIPDRLTGKPEQHEKICKILAESIQQNRSRATFDGFDFEIHSSDWRPYEIFGKELENIDNIDIRSHVENVTNKDNTNLLTVFNNHGAIFFTIESSKPDKVVNSLERLIKHAAKNQLTGYRPGIICVRLSDLTPDQLVDLAYAEQTIPGGSSIQRMTNKILSNSEYRHIVQICYTSTGEGFSTTDGTARHVQLSGPAYVFSNQSHPLKNDHRLKLFRQR